MLYVCAQACRGGWQPRMNVRVSACSLSAHLLSGAHGRVFVNGQEVPQLEPRGMFLRRRLDVTQQLSSGLREGANASLAVLVAPPDNVGDVDLGCGTACGLSAMFQGARAGCSLVAAQPSPLDVSGAKG